MAVTARTVATAARHVHATVVVAVTARTVATAARHVHATVVVAVTARTVTTAAMHFRAIVAPAVAACAVNSTHSRHCIFSTHIFYCQARRIAKSVARSSKRLEPSTKCPSSSEYAKSFSESSRPPRARVIHFTGS